MFTIPRVNDPVHSCQPDSPKWHGWGKASVFPHLPPTHSGLSGPNPRAPASWAVSHPPPVQTLLLKSGDRTFASISSCLGSTLPTSSICLTYTGLPQILPPSCMLCWHVPIPPGLALLLRLQREPGSLGPCLPGGDSGPMAGAPRQAGRVCLWQPRSRGCWDCGISSDGGGKAADNFAPAAGSSLDTVQGAWALGLGLLCEWIIYPKPKPTAFCFPTGGRDLALFAFPFSCPPTTSPQRLVK